MRAYKIIRAVIVTMLSLVIAIPLLLYIGLSLPIVQEKICAVAETELTKVLGTDVEIGSLSIKPFNQVILKDVHIADSAGEQAAIVKKIGAGISLYDLMSGGNIVINYAELIGLDAHIHRAAPDAPLNIQNIIDNIIHHRRCVILNATWIRTTIAIPRHANKLILYIIFDRIK